MLIAAVAARDGKLLMQLALANRSAIARNFADWQRVPETIRTDQQAMQRYANMLIAVAETFRDRLDDASLMNRLVGNAPEKPLGKWEARLRESDALARELRFEEARQVLSAVLMDLRDTPEQGPVAFHAITHARLGHLYFATGDVENAREHMHRALELSQARGDGQGIAAALAGLYEISRYEGRFAEAADFADQLAGHLTNSGNTADAQTWAQQAARVRAGEPLCRVVFFVNDRQYEVEDMPPLTEARVRVGFARNRRPLTLCEGLVQRAMHLASQGKFDEALADFRAAAKADPFDPNPHYHAAVTLMHLQQASEAVAEYDAAEERAPGWFHVRAERWLAAQIAGGQVDQAIFFILRTEEMPEQSVNWDQKLSLADQGLAAAPNVALLHLYRGKCLLHLNRMADAEASYRAGLAIAQEPDARTRLLFDLHMVTQDFEEKKRLLTEAADLNGNLAAGAIAKVALRQMTAGPGGNVIV